MNEMIDRLRRERLGPLAKTLAANLRQHAVKCDPVFRIDPDAALMVIEMALIAAWDEALKAAAFRLDDGRQWSPDGLGGMVTTNSAADAVRSLMAQNPGNSGPYG